MISQLDLSLLERLKMDDDLPKDAPDPTLSRLGKEDLYDLSVGDLEKRIKSLKTEIVRAEKAIEARGDTRSEAEKLFNL